jgi:quinol monooxygenase YgiN
VDLLTSSLGVTRAAKGCLECHVATDVEDDAGVHFFGAWESRDGLERHVRSPEFWAVLVALDLCDEKPLVRIEEVTKSRGLEAIETIRGLTNHETTR